MPIDSGVDELPTAVNKNKVNTTTFQKLLIILAFAITIVLSSLTASLPLPIRRDQSNFGVDSAGTETLDRGDTAWMIIATMSAILIAPATAYLYGKNICNCINISLIYLANLPTKAYNFLIALQKIFLKC
jgi:hypothetical protein